MPALRCRFGFHDWLGHSTALHGTPGFENAIRLEVCAHCEACRLRFVPPVAPGDVVDFAMRFETERREEPG